MEDNVSPIRLIAISQVLVFEEMEAFQKDAVDTTESMWMNMFPSEGVCYQWMGCESWVYPPSSTMGIPTALCLN